MSISPDFLREYSVAQLSATTGSLTGDLLSQPATVRNRNKPFVAGPLGMVCGYLSPADLRLVDLVNRFFNEAAESGWQARAQENHCPEMPLDFSYKRFVSQTVPRMFGKEFHEAYFGKLPDSVPPIPVSFIAAASKATRLVYVPSQMEVTHSNSTRGLSLDASGRLVENLEGERTLVAPMNLFNMGFVVENCLKQGHRTGFSESSWHEVLRQHGTAPVAGGWFLLIEAAQEKGKCYIAQKSAVEGRRMEVSCLTERVWGEVCKFIQTGKAPALDPENSFVRTTIVTLDGTTPYQTSLWWENAAGPSPRLCLVRSILDHYDGFGVAVGVPAR